MDCPNCKSDQIIQVQDQHFCISCGQPVPAEQPKAAKGAAAHVAVQDNGLPEGVKILPVAASKAAKPAAPPETPAPEPTPTVGPKPAPANVPKSPLIKFRNRIKPATEEEEGKPAAEAEKTPEPPAPAGGTEPEPTPAVEPEPAAAPEPEPAPSVPIITEPKAKKRKPGRPKAGRLDQPKVVASTMAAALPAAPAVATPEPEPAPATGPKRMSDLSRREAPAEEESEEPAAKPAKAKKKSGGGFFGFHQAKTKAHKEPVHKVGVPPLHYGAVLSFSLRAKVRPRLVVMGSLAAVSLAVAAAYGAWLYSQDGLTNLSQTLATLGPKMLVVGILLAALYYIGRSISQTAIIYGVAREADSRPVPLARQFGIGINTFGRRLALDLGFFFVELTLLGLVLGLVWFGGAAWPVDALVQRVALYFAFLILLYLISSLAIARGLAGVILTLTPKHPKEAAEIGWQLFSHRFELLGMRTVGLTLELLLALPLVAVGVALIASAPAYDLAVAAAVGILALVAGGLFGAGTAAWWAALYRRIILVDHPGGAVTLLSGRQPQEANRTPLAVIISLSTLLIAAILALPWLNVL